MWVLLKTIKHIEIQGKLKRHAPGDWVNVGKQLALLWISEGDAEIPKAAENQFDMTDLGMVVTNSVHPKVERLDEFTPKIEYIITDACLHYARTLIWNPSTFLRLELLQVGFSFLDKWDVACPINYEVLISQIGTDEERALTKSVIHDLRVPVYDTRLMFVRRNEITSQLIDLWMGEVEDGHDEQLAFVRALYVVRPLILALPATWTDENAPRG